MLHSVHSISPPTNITKNQGRDLISQKNSTGRGNMDHNEENIGMAYQWRKFHSTDDARKMQKNSTPCQESLQTKIL